MYDCGKPQEYSQHINSILKPSQNGSITTLDLFAGAGGLALGFEAQGFKTVGFEKDADCCVTYKNNLRELLIFVLSNAPWGTIVLVIEGVFAYPQSRDFKHYVESYKACFTALMAVA